MLVNALIFIATLILVVVISNSGHGHPIMGMMVYGLLFTSAFGFGSSRTDKTKISTLTWFATLFAIADMLMFIYGLHKILG